MPHAKRVRSGAHLRAVSVESTITRSVGGGKGTPAHLETTDSTQQPAAPALSPVCDTQIQHQQAAPSIQQKSLSAAVGAKALPVLPWMRVPISIEGGTGVPLQQVTGLHPLALAALQTGMHTAPCGSGAAQLQQIDTRMSQSLLLVQVNTQSCFLCKQLPGVSWLVDLAKHTTCALPRQQAVAKPWLMLCLCCTASLGTSFHSSLQYSLKRSMCCETCSPCFSPVSGPGDPDADATSFAGHTHAHASGMSWSSWYCMFLYHQILRYLR